MISDDEVVDGQMELAKQVFRAADEANEVTLAMGMLNYELNEGEARQAHMIGLINAVAKQIWLFNGKPLNAKGLPNDMVEFAKIGDALVRVVERFIG